jgi:hypothetical protein
MNPKHCRLFIFSLASISLAICATQTLQAQSSTTSQSLSDEQLEQRFANAHNRWRLTTVDYQSQRDTVAPDIRAVRNEYWKTKLQPYRDIENAHGSWAYSGGTPPVVELFLTPEEAWVIVTFDHFLVVPIDPDFQLLYTEINFRINQVVYQPSSSSLTPGMSIDMDFEGGRIKKPNGDIVSWLLTPNKYYFQPGHTYLMQIEGPSHPGGVYYCQERWDVSTGIAVPDTEDLVSFALSGTSKISGKTTQEAIAYLQSVLK